MKTTLIYPVLYASIMMLNACGPAKSTDAVQAPATFPVLTLQPQNTQLFQEYPATLEGEETVEIRAKVNGYIEKVYVKEGALVQPGQALFKLDANSFLQEVNHKNAAVQAAAAALETASIQTSRTAALVAKKIVNSFELVSAKNTERVRQAELNQAKADLSAAKTQLAYTNIVSPIRGVVGSLPFKTGSLVSTTSTAALTTVANTNRIFAYFSLSEQQLNNFLDQFPGAHTKEKLTHMPEVSLILSGGNTYPVKGKIETLSGVLNATTGAANFKAIFPNPDARLWSGASATISIPKVVDKALMIPKAATFEQQGQYFVFRVDQQQNVHHTPVQILNTATEKNYIVTKGLTAGDVIVAEGLGNLKDGMKIKPAQAPSK